AASEITTPMLVAAANAIANCVASDELNASYIVPSVFDPKVALDVAEAVVLASGATKDLDGSDTTFLPTPIPTGAAS
ncbi:MAG: hypothetical protein ABIU87_02220, partial [Ornithinibacter sp.]